MDFFPTVLLFSGITGVVCSVAVFFFVCRGHLRTVGKTIIGSEVPMRAWRNDPVYIFRATGLPAFTKDRDKPLPPLPDPAIAREDRIDEEVCSALEVAVRAAYNRGKANLEVQCQGPPPEEVPLREAMDTLRVRGRGLEDRPGIPDLLVRGEAWLRTLEAERTLTLAVQETRPDVDVVSKLRLTAKPHSGIPWQTTTIGNTIEGQLRHESWERIEALSSTLREAKAAGAGRLVVKQADELLEELIAKTKLLPADRCVLDPDGNGLKLLPQGTKRSLSVSTGDIFTYEPHDINGGVVQDELPPADMLGGVSCDQARPVCAVFAKKGACKLGRRCPWRHVKPRPDDVIREPLLLEDA